MRNKVMGNKARCDVVFVVCLMLLSVAFSGCDDAGYSGVDEMIWREGKQGVQLSFKPNSPPDVVLSGDEFTALVHIQNKGAHSLKRGVDESGNTVYDDYAVLEITHNPFYLRQTFADTFQKSIYLEGKSRYVPMGDGVLQEYGFKALEPMGQRESPDTNLIFTLCYPYQTILVEDVCVDLDYYSADEREKVCTTRDYTYTDGQGAPIAITKIEPKGVVSQGNRLVEFAITIENVGGGNVIARDNDVTIEERCAGKKTERLDWNTVFVEAELMGKPLECSSEGVAYLYENKAIMRCRSGTIDSTVVGTVPEGEGPIVLGTARNFLSSLYVQLDYIYQQTETKKLEIVRVG